MVDLTRSRRSANVVFAAKEAITTVPGTNIPKTTGEMVINEAQQAVNRNPDSAEMRSAAQSAADASASPNHRRTIRPQKVEPLHAGARVHNQGLSKSK